MPELFIEKFPAIVCGDGAPVMVLLHGWQADSRIWDGCLLQLRQSFNVWRIDLPGCGRNSHLMCETANQAVALLAASLSEKSIVIGWSLGGNLAIQLAHDFPQKISALIIIATNPSFVARDNWPGMAPDVLVAFLQSCDENPDKTRQRFLGLQAKGDREEKALLKFLREQPQANWSPAQLVNGLQWLRDLDGRKLLAGLTMPSLHIFGDKDQLVPVACAEYFPSAVTTVVVQETAHLPFISQPDIVALQVKNFLISHAIIAQPVFSHREKQAVAQSFSRAASSYDQVADFQRRSAERLLSHLPETISGSVLDIGSGSGYVTDKLAARFFSAEIFALDLAEGMLRHARQRYVKKNLHWLCGDAENLPLADNSIDLVFSNLAIQWCENPAALFAEMYRVVKPGGQLFIATLGPQTLQELRAAWAAVDGAVHVNHFDEKIMLQQTIQRSGLQIEDWQEQLSQPVLSQLRELLLELKTLGAHNVNPGRPKGLTGRARLQQLQNTYPRNANDELIASWQLWFIHLRKPASIAPHPNPLPRGGEGT